MCAFPKALPYMAFLPFSGKRNGDVPSMRVQVILGSLFPPAQFRLQYYHKRQLSPNSLTSAY